MMKGRVCELCINGEGAAALYCPSDSAFLCWNCDAKVHEVNFLVTRHIRFPLCSKCNEPITDNNISGVGFQPFSGICRLCSFESPAADDLHFLSSSSSSSACMSYAESSSTPPLKRSSVDFDRVKIACSSSVTELSSSSTSTSKKENKATTLRCQRPTDSKVEDIIASWCTKLGLSGIISGVAVPVAVKAFDACYELSRDLPSRRVSLAASLWLSLRLCVNKSASTWQVLKRLEEMSGVPANIIVAGETKLAHVLSSRKRRFRCQQPEEGWDETSQCCV